MKDTDTEMLARKGAAQVRSLNFKRLLKAGILHTKFMLVDNTHFLVGSANFDWRALTQVRCYLIVQVFIKLLKKNEISFTKFTDT